MASEGNLLHNCSLDNSMQVNSCESHSDSEPRLRDIPLTLLNLPRIILLGLIRFYQMTISKTLPTNTCRFYPSCSHYGYQVIYKYGVLRGGWMATWRVLRCNPFNPGGYDPVP
jgi:putative membrane protein insertion efficiency factor